MVDNFKFMSEENWSQIQRGKIFIAAVPFVGKRPLEFFIQDKTSPHTGKARRGTVVAYNNDFDSNDDKLEIVLGLKARRVAIITNDKLNHDVDQEDVNIAKIYSVKPDDHQEDWYEPAVNGTHPFFVYLPETVTGVESIIDISSITTIHKNMLLEEKENIEDYLPVIESKIDYCFKMGIYQKQKSEEIV